MPAPATRLSGLTTRGRCLIAGGAATAACAVVLDERDLLRLGLFVVVLPLFAAVLAARTRRAVRVRRRIAPDRLSVGSAGEVTLEVRGGPVLGPLRLTDVVPDAAGARSDQPPRFAVHRLTPRAPVALTYPLRPVLRGVHRIGSPDRRGHRPARARRVRPRGRAGDPAPGAAAHRAALRDAPSARRRRGCARRGRGVPGSRAHRRPRAALPARRRAAAGALAQHRPPRRADRPARGAAVAGRDHRAARPP